MPSAYFANPGIVTGIWPAIGISPKSAFTADTSEGGVLLNVARYAAVLGNALSKYGLPIATIATGAGPSVNFAMKGVSSPFSPTLPRFAATVANAAITMVEHFDVSPPMAPSPAAFIDASTTTICDFGANLRYESIMRVPAEEVLRSTTTTRHDCADAASGRTSCSFRTS